MAAPGPAHVPLESSGVTGGVAFSWKGRWKPGVRLTGREGTWRRCFPPSGGPRSVLRGGQGPGKGQPLGGLQCPLNSPGLAPCHRAPAWRELRAQRAGMRESVGPAEGVAQNGTKSRLWGRLGGIGRNGELSVHRPEAPHPSQPGHRDRSPRESPRPSPRPEVLVPLDQTSFPAKMETYPGSSMH